MVLLIYLILTRIPMTLSPVPSLTRFDVFRKQTHRSRAVTATNYTHTHTTAIPRAEIRGRNIDTANGGKMASCRCCAYFFGAIVAIVLCTFVTIEIFPYPLRASCTVKWGFDEPCIFVAQRLRCQILKWTGCRDCGHRGNRCLYSAKSVSRAWFVMFDYGTNYCNLRNLVDGAGLNTDRGFMELTNEAICTQLNTAICI